MAKIKKYTLTACLLFFFVHLITAQVKPGDIFTCKIIRVYDGDTATGLLQGNRQVRIRLYRIDAPEKSQDFGEKSRLYLANLIAGKDVIIKVASIDRYGRLVGRISTTHHKDISLEMIRQGWAWHYTAYDNTLSYKKAFIQAQTQKKGMWKTSVNIEPWKWRKQKK